MKIAVIAPTAMPARRANTIQVAKMTQAFCQLGHETRLVAFPSPSQSGEQVSWHDLASLYGLNQEFPVTWITARALWRGYDYGIAAVRWAQAWGADLIYTRLPQCAAIASLSGAATIFELHDFPRRMTQVLLQGFLWGKGKRRLVVITQALLNDLVANLKLPKNPPFVIVAPDGVDLHRYEGLPESPQARHLLTERFPAFRNLRDRFTIGFTGHMYAGRGSEMLLNLAAALPECNFLLVGGEESEAHNIRQQAHARKLKNTLVTGFVPNANLPLFQACCDVLLMPYQEKVAASSGGNIAAYFSPMKLFEYLACGRVIVSSDLPVLREVLNDTNAILLPPGKLEAWVDALNRVQVEPAYRKYLSENARSDSQRYSWEKRAESILVGLAPV